MSWVGDCFLCDAEVDFKNRAEAAAHFDAHEKMWVAKIAALREALRLIIDEEVCLCRDGSPICAIERAKKTLAEVV